MSNGDPRLVLDLLSLDGFGFPWGHTLVYSGALPDRTDFGNGYRRGGTGEPPPNVCHWLCQC